MNHDNYRQQAAAYYAEKLQNHGPVPQGVDWNSAEGQTLRFEQLCKVLPADAPCSVLDFGCGYGALYPFLKAHYPRVHYSGYDASAGMISEARRLYPDAAWYAHLNDFQPADYAIASGVFNVKQHTDEESWAAYIQHELLSIKSLTTKGLAFNILTAYADAQRKRPDLYYADPGLWFGFCKQQLGPRVALLHDYPLYEFTLIVQYA